MQDLNIPGEVLLIDRGVEFFSAEKGPSPKIENWFKNWGIYGEAFETKYGDGDSSDYPVTPTGHRGIGGCSTHDTRITFQLREAQKKRMAHHMGWTVDRLNTYYQAALNLMPISPAIPKGTDK